MHGRHGPGRGSPARQVRSAHQTRSSSTLTVNTVELSTGSDCSTRLMRTKTVSFTVRLGLSRAAPALRDQLCSDLQPFQRLPSHGGADCFKALGTLSRQSDVMSTVCSVNSTSQQCGIVIFCTLCLLVGSFRTSRFSRSLSWALSVFLLGFSRSASLVCSRTSAVSWRVRRRDLHNGRGRGTVESGMVSEFVVLAWQPNQFAPAAVGCPVCSTSLGQLPNLV